MDTLRKLTKNDCGDEMPRQEVRSLQLDMLRTLTCFCEENGLRCYLSGGTLLGAIRHQGFIPWDDDIDVNLPRPDCDRLLELTGGRLGKYFLEPPDRTGFSYNCEFYRMYAPQAVIENWEAGYAKEPFYLPVFIDLFPIEGLPDGRFATALHYAKIVSVRKMQRLARLKHMEGRSAAAHVFHVLAWIPARLVGYANWADLLQKIARKYRFDEQTYVGVMTAPVHTTNEKVRKSEYLPQVKVSFEGEEFPAPADYDVYLSQLYGEYMKMPPPEKRCSHHAFRVFRNRNWEETNTSR